MVAGPHAAVELTATTQEQLMHDRVGTDRPDNFRATRPAGMGRPAVSAEAAAGICWT
jgi:hypothetical protein